MSELVDYTLYDSVAVITLNYPPINALSQRLQSGILSCLKNALADDQVEAVVITSALQLFCAGGDISEFQSSDFPAEPLLPVLQDEIEASIKLVVAGINGSAFGGGLEVALACHYRIAHVGAKMGLPEVSLGILPGAGGTQRLPRLAGVQTALEMITSGRPVSANKAVSTGFIDRLFSGEGDFLAATLEYTRQLLTDKAPLRNCSALRVATDGLPDDFFNEFRRSIERASKGYYAPERCIQAVEAACNLPFRNGLKKERELFAECMATSQARAQQHLFFAERAATKIPGVDPKTAPRKINKVAVIGAGTMGGGIAMNFANAGFRVKILEVKQDALERGMAVIRNNYEITAKRGKLTLEQVEERMSLLTGVLDYADLADADLVIEAVFENMELKKQIFQKLDQVCKPGAILASNTSTLNVDEIAAATQRPADVVGLHFFSPANVMRLLEIVRGKETSGDVLVTTIRMAQKIGKVPVVVGVCFGFVGNRMLEPYMREAMRLVLEGAVPEQVDGVLTRFGLAMGVLSMIDLAGNDVSFLVRESRRSELAHDSSYQIMSDKLYHLGRYGQKTKRGFYIYEGRERLNDPNVISIAEETAAQLGIVRRSIGDDEILERCIYMLINEGAQILDEGIACRSGDCDLVWVHGYGFPLWRGGPLQYADETGLDKVLAAINKYRVHLGAYGEMWFKPAPLLEKLVLAGKKFADYQS